jgi:protein phosphatase
LSLVADEFLGVPVICGSCQRSFWVRSPLAARPTHVDITPVRCEVGGASAAGPVRKENEDSFLSQLITWSSHAGQGESVLAIVADGLGGHEAGEEASQLVLRTTGSVLLPLLTGEALGRSDKLTSQAVADGIASALQAANREVHTRARQEGRLRGMGATAAVVVVRNGEARIGHVGDARVYHVHADQLTQVTKDQTLAARMVELGQLSPKEARAHPARNEVYQAIGHHPQVQPAHHQVRLAAGDWLIVASDGLHADVDAEELRRTVVHAEPSALRLAAALVDLASQNGGSDNCTVVAVRCY